MKKIMLTLTIVLAMIAGKTYAQTATEGGTSNEVKKEKLKDMTPEERQKVMMETGGKRNTGEKIKANPSKKARLMKHKEQIKANASNKEEAKDYIQEQHQDQKDKSQKEKVIDHKDQIIEKAGSKEEAKAKLQRKHDKHKND